MREISKENFLICFDFNPNSQQHATWYDALGKSKIMVSPTLRNYFTTPASLEKNKETFKFLLVPQRSIKFDISLLFDASLTKHLITTLIDDITTNKSQKNLYILHKSSTDDLYCNYEECIFTLTPITIKDINSQPSTPIITNISTQEIVTLAPKNNANSEIINHTKDQTEPLLSTPKNDQITKATTEIVDLTKGLYTPPNITSKPISKPSIITIKKIALITAILFLCICLTKKLNQNIF